MAFLGNFQSIRQCANILLEKKPSNELAFLCFCFKKQHRVSVFFRIIIVARRKKLIKSNQRVMFGKAETKIQEKVEHQVPRRSSSKFPQRWFCIVGGLTLSSHGFSQSFCLSVPFYFTRAAASGTLPFLRVLCT